MPQTLSAVVIAMLLGLTACSGARSPTSSEPQSASNPVTRLEPVQTQPVTTLETDTGLTTTLTTTQAGQTTTISVQQAMTDLAAQQTSEGLLIVLPDNILFDFDKFNIRASAEPTLAKLAVLLKNDPQAPVSIHGHTDSIGSDAYNQTLSQKRADAVKTYLVQKLDIAADRLQTKGFGEAEPVAPNTNPDGSDNPQGRQKNRRVEVIIHNQG